MRWVQVVVLGDSETNEPVSFEVNLVPISEPDSAQRQLTKLIDAGVDIKAFGGDGGFDKIKLWEFLKKRRIRPIIKPDKNARTDSDSSWRNINAMYRNEHGYEAWASAVKYGVRWPPAEGLFSAIKRMFGEQLRAKSEVGMIQETMMKFCIYKNMKQYSEA